MNKISVNDKEILSDINNKIVFYFYSGGQMIENKIIKDYLQQIVVMLDDIQNDRIESYIDNGKFGVLTYIDEIS
jgi:hypothetical protein